MLGKQGAAKPDEIGPWSEEKLQLLGSYLKAYSDIMNAKKREWLRKYHYIDAFAGSVYPKPKELTITNRRPVNGPKLWIDEPDTNQEDDIETTRYISGSPIRALETQPPFDVCWFIDISSWRLNQLEQLHKQFPNRDIRIKKGDCNQILRETIVRDITWSSFQRGVVFLDPYGLQVEWATVQALAQAKTFDIFVNFPLMAITRLLKRDEQPEGSVIELLNQIMGDTNWSNNLYQAAPQLPLFGDQLMVRGKIDADWLASRYAEQLGRLLKWVSKPVIMTNSKNSPLYALFLASHKDTAVKIMDSISRTHQLRTLTR